MKAVLVCLFLFSGLAAAQDLTLSKFNEDKTKFIAIFSGSAPRLDAEYVFKDEFDQPCRGKVIKVTNTALLEIFNCKIAKNLKGGEKFILAEPEVADVLKNESKVETLAAASPAPVPSLTPSPNPVIRSDRRVRIAATVFYSMASDIKFESVQFRDTGASDSGSVTYGSDGAAGLGLEVYQTNPANWGWGVGLQYDLKRNINNQSISTAVSGSAKVEFASPKPYLEVVTLYSNAVYRWEEVYLPFGLNYTISPTFKQGAGATGSISTKGGLGMQVGFGAIASEVVSFELYYRMLAFNQSSKSGTLSVDHGTGYLSGFNLQAKFSFK